MSKEASNRTFAPLSQPPRLLMGPGPINCYPRVLSAMSTQLVGQYDPVMTGYMNEVMQLYRDVFNTKNQQTFLVDGTSRAGIEAVLVSAIEPGDKFLYLSSGVLGICLLKLQSAPTLKFTPLKCRGAKCLRLNKLKKR